MHLAFLASDFFIRSVGWILAWFRYLLSKEASRWARCKTREGIAPKERVPEIGGDRSTCNGRLTRVNSVRGVEVRSWGDYDAARIRQRG